MTELIFATSNKAKAATLQQHFDRLGIAVRVVAKPLDLTEQQADEALEVAEAKAQQAYQQLGVPLVVDDSAFHIPALNGFPGVYQKYVFYTVGPQGILKLMEGVEDRRAYFISNLVYVDDRGKLHSFSDNKYWGTIATSYSKKGDIGWGGLGRLFIPQGSDVVNALLSPDERYALGQAAGFEDAYAAFARWYIQQLNAS